MFRDEEDRVIGTVLKTRKFSVKSLHSALEPDDPLLSRGASFGVLVCHLRWLFLLGRRLVGKP